jgi:cell division control protein 7
LKEICIELRKSVIKSIISSKSKNQYEKNELIIEFPDSAYDLLKKLLELDSDKRISAEEALKHSFFQNK